MHNHQIYEEACEWFVRMRDDEDSLAVRTELMAWLRRSPEHVSAYLDIAAIWMEARSVEVDSKLELAIRIATAKADARVSELSPGAARPVAGHFNRGWRFALAASVLLLVAGASAVWWKFEKTTYSTGLGEQRSIALRDGSTIELNSQSRVRVHLGPERRMIELLSGQALFHVAKDSSRPFIVRADGTAVRAIGTVFDVYRRNESAVVTVVEGTVLIEPARSPAAVAALRNGTATDADAQAKPIGLRLTAGKQVVVRPEAAAEPKSVNVMAATAWTRRELIFEYTPLAEAAEELNRYNERKLSVEGEELRAFKISAIFRSTDPAAFVRYMRNMPGVRIEENEDSIVITSGR